MKKVNNVKDLELKLLVREALIQQLKYRINKAIEVLRFDGFISPSIEKALKILEGEDNEK